MKKTFSLFSNHTQFLIPRDSNCLEKISKKIQNEIMQNEQYLVVSNVRNEIFQIFLDFWIKNIEPLFDSDNIYELNLLMNEFDLKSKNIIIGHEELLRISILKYDFSSLLDKSESEKYIAKHLDFYIKKYMNQIKCIPITSLYNIFYHEERVLYDQNLAYSFITDENAKDSICKFTLLGSLDANKLKKENVQDSIINRDKHYGFSVQNESLYIRNQENQIHIKNIEKNNFERKNDLQQQEIDRLQQQIGNLSRQKNEIIDNLNKQIQFLHEKNEAKQQQINKLQEQIQQQNQNKKALENHIQRQQKKESNFKSQVQLQNQKNEDIIQQLNDEISRKDEIIEKKNQEILQNQRTINDQLQQIQIKTIQLSNTIDMRAKVFFNTLCNTMKTSYLRFQAFIFSQRFLIYTLIALLFSLFIIFIVFKNQIMRQYYKYYANKDHVDSIFMYAKYLDNGIGGSENKEESINLYKIAADKGCFDAILAYINILKEKEPNKKNQINKYSKMAADLGCSEAMRYYSHAIIDIDKNESIKYLKMAADNGDVESMYEYAEIRSNSTNVDNNMTEAIIYYRMAAAKSHIKAILFLAKLYYTGSFDGIKNYEIAFSYYKKASEMDDAEATNMCARMMFFGQGTKVSKILSYIYYKEAERLGYKKYDPQYSQLIEERNTILMILGGIALLILCGVCGDNKNNNRNYY